MKDICIVLGEEKSWFETGRRPRYFTSIFCRSFGNYKKAKKEIEKCGCKKKSKTNFLCPDYTHYMRAYNKMNKVI